MKTYVVWDGRGVKVGKAANVQTRLSQLQTGNPNRLLLLGTLESNVESEIQAKLRPHRMHQSGPGREWFDGYACARELALLMRQRDFAFSEGWRLFVEAAATNRMQRRRGWTRPGNRERVAAHAYDRAALRTHDSSRKLHDQTVETASKFIRLVITLRQLQHATYGGFWCRIGRRLRLIPHAANIEEAWDVFVEEAPLMLETLQHFRQEEAAREGIAR